MTGGFVYRGAAIPDWQGKYVFGDYGSTSGFSDGRLMGIEETGNQVEISGDLVAWTAIVESEAGGAAAGQNGGVVDSDDPHNLPVRLVTARKNLPAGSNSRQYARLRVERY